MSHPRVAFVTKHVIVCLSQFCFLLFQPFPNTGSHSGEESGQNSGQHLFSNLDFMRDCGNADKTSHQSHSFPGAISTLFKLICVWGFVLPLDWLQTSSGILGRGSRGSSRCTCRALKVTWAIFLVACLLSLKGFGRVLKSKVISNIYGENIP